MNKTMIIKVFGPGCVKCESLIENTQKAIDDIGLSYEIEKISDINSIVEEGIMATPALMINDKVVSSGRLPSVEEIKIWLS